MKQPENSNDEDLIFIWDDAEVAKANYEGLGKRLARSRPGPLSPFILMAFSLLAVLLLLTTCAAFGAHFPFSLGDCCMAVGTAIQWCDDSVNPVNGCAGCELFSPANRRGATCYAFKYSTLRRNHKGFTPDFAQPKLFAGRMARAAAQSDLAGIIRPDKPWLARLPRLIFVSDMGDALSETGAIDEQNKPVVGGAVPFEFLKAEIIDNVVSDNGRRHIWLWLTKRPHRLRLFQRWLKGKHGVTLPANLWLGTSVTSGKTIGRVKQLAAVGDSSTTRFLSVEPLWEEVSLAPYLPRIGWVITGGESGGRNSASRFECNWARKLKSECAKAQVPFFVKQLGGNISDNGVPLILSDSHAGDWTEWPLDLKVRQLPGIAPSRKDK